ncbi:MAG: MerR family transcriptional regulator [Paraburkholderia sp.]|nr:MAG: MerR family transcriptional regulator [Paraburkholderia sp.]
MLISKLATLSGLSKDGIRHYEELGLIRSTARQAGSRTYREYDTDALAAIAEGAARPISSGR